MSGRVTGFPEILEQGRPLQIGFVPDRDCAPIVAAREAGLFDKYELRVDLHRETRWSDIRDKVTYGELDAAHAPATLPFVTNLCLDSDQSACLAGMVLSLQGNAITVSESLWNDGVRDAQTFRDVIYRHWGRRTFTFGIVFPHSPAYFLLRQWLKSGGVSPHAEMRIVVVPPAQMYPMLKLGYIDGYCAGEPWSSLAVESDAGRCVATSADVAPLHPEKVLMVRRDFAEERAREHERLIGALVEACAFCDGPGNRALLGDMLSQPQYVNAPADCLKGSLSVFHQHNANDPTNDKAAWLIGQLYELMEQSPLTPRASGRTPVLKNIFRHDIFQRAKAGARDQTRALMAEAENYGAQATQTG